MGYPALFRHEISGGQVSNDELRPEQLPLPGNSSQSGEPVRQGQHTRQPVWCTNECTIIVLSDTRTSPGRQPG